MPKILTPLIPANEIHPKFRNLATIWCENYRPHDGIMPMIAQKQKLGSDMQNNMLDILNAFVKSLHDNGDDEIMGDRQVGQWMVNEFKNYLKTSSNGKKAKRK